MDTVYQAATEILARSSTLTSVGWIGYIIIGAIAGWIAGKIVRGSGDGILMNIVIGIVGALIGGFLLSFFLNTAGGGWWFTLFTAVLGSVILLWLGGAALAAVVVLAGMATYAAIGLLHPRRQFLHDMLCGTQLIHWKAERRR